MIAGLIIVLLVRAVIDGLRQFVMAYTGERVIFDLRRAMFAHLQDVSLGTLIGDYAGAALTFPWEFYFPAGFLIALVLAINLVGDGLRDAFDPRSRE